MILSFVSKTRDINTRFALFLFAVTKFCDHILQAVRCWFFKNLWSLWKINDSPWSSWLKYTLVTGK